jgi:hypothetical protein
MTLAFANILVVQGYYMSTSNNINSGNYFWKATIEKFNLGGISK